MSFLRLYFVGDADLLEITGNSKDILRIMKHLSEMFAGISMLADLLCDAVAKLQSFYRIGSTLDQDQLMTWMEKYPAQLVTLAVQVAWTTSVESSLTPGRLPESPLDTIKQALGLLADIVLRGLKAVTRRKCGHLITEPVHQHDVTELLSSNE